MRTYCLKQTTDFSILGVSSRNMLNINEKRFFPFFDINPFIILGNGIQAKNHINSGAVYADFFLEWSARYDIHNYGAFINLRVRILKMNRKSKFV